MTANDKAHPEAGHLRHALRLVRLRGWWDKLLLAGGAAFLILPPAGTDAARAPFPAFLAVALLFLIYGYVYNDICDAEQDGRASSAALERRRRLVAFASALGGAVVLVLAFRRPAARLVGAAYLLLATAYSARPVRLKERGILGVLAGAVAQRPLVFLIYVGAVGAWDGRSALLAAWLFLGGVLGMLGHQVKDYENDLRAGVRTFTATHGRRTSLALCWLALVALGLTTLAPAALLPAPEGPRLTAGLCILALVPLGQVALSRLTLRKGSS